MRVHPRADPRQVRRPGRAGPNPVRRLGERRQRTRAPASARHRRCARRRREPRSGQVRADRQSRAVTGWSAGPGPMPVPSVALVILDGWGLEAPGPGNAVELANTPNFDELWAKHTTTTLTACGRA